MPSFTLEPSALTLDSLPTHRRIGREDDSLAGFPLENGGGNKSFITRSSSVPLATSSQEVKVVSDTCSYGAESKVVHRPKGGHPRRLIVPQRGGDRYVLIATDEYVCVTV